MVKSKKIIILLVIVWFVLIWPFLLVVGFKPKGGKILFKLAAQKFINLGTLPDPLILYDFASRKDSEVWDYEGIEYFVGGLKFFGPKESQEKYPGLLSESYYLGPGEQRDWSGYHFLEFGVSNPSDTDVSLHVMIKDVYGFKCEKIFDLKQHEKQVFVINLEDLEGQIDLKNMFYLKIFLVGPQETISLLFDNIRLREKMLKIQRLSYKPVIELSNIIYPKVARLGETLEAVFYFTTSRKLKNNYKVFVHIVPSEKIGKGLRFIRGQINADFYPDLPTSKWLIDKMYIAGPVKITIPVDNPKGEYSIMAGLFNAEQKKAQKFELKFRFHITDGPFDFSGSYPKLRYFDKKEGGYLVGRFQIKE